jgi:hypothetical protein
LSSRDEPRSTSDRARARTAAAPKAADAREPRSHARLEAWSVGAWFVGVLFLVLIVYLGLRPGGSGPVLAYNLGRDLVMLLALITLLLGVAWSALHRPFMQRRRFFPFLCLCAVIGVAEYPFPYPSSHEGHASPVCMRLPVEGEWTVFWGGDTKEESLLSAYFADRRFGLDLVVTENGVSHRGDGLAASDYFAFDKRVLAPAAGAIVHVSDRAPDTPPGEYDSRVEAFGNYVVLEVAPSEFVFLCHLRQGSISVREGERVEAGAVLGRVGSSGYSTVTPEPHLAIHMQDTPIPRRGEAIPWSFCDYSARARDAVSGERVARGVPHGGIGRDGAFLGQRVQALASGGR